MLLPLLKVPRLLLVVGFIIKRFPPLKKSKI
nr:MAG TPA: hypothetical protein [Caudoviricetes sp.]